MTPVAKKKEKEICHILSHSGVEKFSDLRVLVSSLWKH